MAVATTARDRARGPDGTVAEVRPPVEDGGARVGAVRQWAALAVLVLPALFVSLDGALLTFALPQLSRDLTPSATQLVWLTDAYALMLAALLVPMGALGDRIGRRRLLVIGSAGYGATALAASLLTDPGHLIAARAVLGVFGATLMPSSLGLLRSTFECPRRRRAAVAVWAAAFAVGAGLAPVLGAAVLAHARSVTVLAIAAPPALLAAFGVARLVDEARSPQRGRIDGWSLGWSVAALGALVYGVTTVASGDGAGWLSIAGAAGAGYVFVRRQLRRPHPLLDLRLLRRPALAASVGVNLLSQAAFVGLALWASQYLQLVAGLDPQSSARHLVVGPAAAVLAGACVVPLARRVPLRLLLPGALAVSAAGYALATAGASTAATVAVVVACVGFGAGLGEALTADAVLASVPPARAGAAASVAETAFELGAALGVAIMGTVLATTYRARLDLPAGLGAGDAEAASHTLGAAAGVARDHGPGGAALLESAREAFTAGVQATSAVCLTLAVVAAVGAFLVLRRA